MSANIKFIYFEYFLLFQKDHFSIICFKVNII